MLKNAKIITQMIVVFTVLIVVNLLIFIFLLNKLIHIQSKTEDLYNHPFTVSNTVKEIKIQVTTINKRMMDILFLNEQDKIEEEINTINTMIDEEISNRFHLVRERYLGNMEDVDEVITSIKEWESKKDNFFDLIRSNQIEKARELYNGNTIKPILDLVNKLDDFASSKAVSLFESSQTEAKDAIRISVIVIIAAMTVLTILGITVIISMRRGLNQIIQKVKNLSQGEGDLTSRVDIVSNNEMGLLAKYFNTFIEHIQGLIIDVKDNVNVMASSTSDIESVIKENNKGLVELASSIVTISESSQNNASISQESNASIEEISSNSEVIAEESEEAYTNINEVLNSANVGEKAIIEVVQSNNSVKESSKELQGIIQGLKHSSDRVEEILDIITNISEQTNLLALNAAIEAARAGEQGKGFAVVSDDIRKLAKESKESSNKIGVLLKEIKDGAEKANHSILQSEELSINSVKKATHANEQFTTILSLIQEVTDKIKKITQSSKHQSTITKDMSKVMEELAVDAQSNAGSVQEINATIQQQGSSFEVLESNVTNLKEIADTLKSKSDKFTV